MGKQGRLIIDELDNRFKIEWSKEYLMPGLKKLAFNKKFTDKELVKFFDLAHTDKYEKIVSNVKGE